MKILGIRCSNKDVTYCVLSGTQTRPKEFACDTVAFPKGYSLPQSLKWLVQEIDGIIEEHGVKAIALKRFEGRTRGKTYEERVMHEAAIVIAGANRGIKHVTKKVNSTIAKDLGQKGRAKYLANLDLTLIPSFRGASDKLKDALTVAWSELNNGS